MGPKESKGFFFSTVSMCNTGTRFCRWYLTIPLVSYRIVMTGAVFDTGIGSALASILNCRRFPLIKNEHIKEIMGLKEKPDIVDIIERKRL